MLKGTGISDGIGLGKAIIYKSQKIKLEKNKIKVCFEHIHMKSLACGVQEIRSVLKVASQWDVNINKKDKKQTNTNKSKHRR